MKSKFWSNDPKDNYRIFRDRKGRMVVKIITPGGVVGLICADIPITTVAALKHKIQFRILERKRTLVEPDNAGEPPTSEG